MAQVKDTSGMVVDASRSASYSSNARYSYDPNTLNEYASITEEAAETIIQLKQDIAKIALEIKGSWKGSSADKYYDNILKYDSDLNLLNTTLKEVAGSLRETATYQQEREAEVKRQAESDLS